MSRRIYFDGLNLSLERGTGIATYARQLARLVRELGYEVGVVYGSPTRPAKHKLMREISFFDNREAMPMTHREEVRNAVADLLRMPFGVQPGAVDLTGAVITDQFRERLPAHDHLYISRNLFANARRYFTWTGRFAELDFETPPDILHCTYQLPLRVKRACNVYTIHDLVPLRLPYTTLDNKRQTYRLLRKIAAEADHIVTVSENSKRDLVELLGIPEERITNTYEAVEFPSELLARSDDAIAEQLRSTYRLAMGDYLLFYGALEPKKNVARLIEAYLLAAVDIPLVITGAGGWGNHEERRLIEELQQADRAGPTPAGAGSGDRTRTSERRRLYQFEYVSLPRLVTLIRGARAVLFPSLYEGFGLPVLEAMLLGTPVVTSRVSSLPEVAGDAALYVDPYDLDDMARAIKAVCSDADLRRDLSERGRQQAQLFSPERYKERLAALYRRLG
ncbi:MAG: glycosyltransferase family 4 protein [Thiohalocapsa sp.]